MSLHYPYRLFPTNHPVLALGGRWVRPRPLIRVSIIGPSGTYVENALLDTAADDTVFRLSAASKIGLDLSNAPTGEASGVGQTPVILRYAQVRLRLTDGFEFREWPAWVGFCNLPLKHPMLGFAGCLQFFTAVFQGDREAVELTINSLYPGT